PLDIQQFAQPVQLISAVGRAKSEKLAPFRMLAQLDQRNTCLRRIRHQLRVRPVHRSESEGQNDNGKERATAWEDPNDPQHPMCITESGRTLKQGQTLIAKFSFSYLASLDVDNVRNVLLPLIRDPGIDAPTPAQRHLTPITYSFRTASTVYFTAFQDE
ncbi:MAG: hypothetical protein WAM03_19240, partial [Pseudolabrys sp.]